MLKIALGCSLLLMMSLLSAQDCSLSLSTTADTVLCSPQSLPLRVAVNGGKAETVSWQPAAGLSNPATAQPTANVTKTTTFTVTVKALDDRNLVSNGDFRLGDTLFSSDYTYGNHLGAPGPLANKAQYMIERNAMATHRQFAPCNDHTTGNDLMMVINADDQASAIWCQTIDIEARADYRFGFWAESVVTENPGRLRLRFNGVVADTVFALPRNTCRWTRYQYDWKNPTNATQVEVCLINDNFTDQGNDFALDDISLQRICRLTDTVRVALASLNAGFAVTPAFCSNDGPVILNSLLSGRATLNGKWTVNGQAATRFEPAQAGPGSHRLTYTVQQGSCTRDSSLTVTVRRAPTAGLATSSPDYCFGTPERLSLASLLTDADAGGKWRALTSLNDPTALDTLGRLQIGRLKGGLYRFLYTVSGDEVCASDTTQVAVRVHAAIPLKMIDSLNLDCVDPVQTLTSGLSADGNYRFDWNRNGDTLSAVGASLKVDQVGTYRLVVTQQATGCDSTAQAVVTSTIEEVTASAGQVDINCDDRRSGQIFVENVSGGSGPYMYRLNGGSYRRDSVFTKLGEGEYKVYVQDIAGCEDTLSVTLVDPTNWTLDLVADGNPIIGLGQTLRLQVATSLPPERIGTVSWSPNAPPCDNCLETVVQPDSVATFGVTVTTVEGCVKTDTLEVLIYIGKIVYVPNVFSPNNDGSNDNFTIFADAGVRDVNFLRVFTRWGQLIYERSDFVPNNLSEGWDGRINDRPAPSGTYVYHTEVVLFDNRVVQLRGEVHLLR